MMKMNKPVMQKEVTVIYTNPKSGMVHLVATKEAMEDFSTFLYNTDRSGNGSFYIATVDPRYDFEGVVDYIENWNPA